VQRDITPRKQAEAALSRSQARLARAMEFGRMGAWEYDAPNQVFTFSDQLYLLLGTTANAEGGYRIAAADAARKFAISIEGTQGILPPERLGASARPGEEWELEHPIRLRDGRLRQWYQRVTSISDAEGRVVGARGVATDITERVEMETERRMLSRAVEQSPVTIVITNARGIIEYANPQFTKVTGYTLAEAVGKNPRVLKSGAQPESIYRDLWQTISAGREWRGEFCNRRKDGTLYWEEVSISPVTNEAGAITHYLAVKEDITARREALECIREQAELLNVTRDAIMVVDLDYRVRFWNRGAELLFGWSQAEAVGRVLDALIYDEARPVPDEARRAIIERDEWTGELRQRTKSGATVVVRSRGMLMRGPSGLPRSILITTSDITEAKRMENQILRTQRLESVGALAVGVAHDLNNVLSPILMSVELIRSLALTSQDREVVRLMSDSARRGADVVRQLLIFGRGSEAPQEVMQVVPVVKEIVRMMRETFPRNLTIEGPTTRSLWPIRGHATQIYQVLLNLCVNARDAMPQGGRLTVMAENLQLDEAAARIHPGARAGAYVRLTVADTGVGVPPEIVDRIFDPFFTTKPQGHGTGLGLSTVVGIAKSHSGFVTVTSRVGEGSQFCVYLAATNDGHEGTAAAETDSSHRGGGETILLIDDETSIRVILGRALVQAGYRTVLAANGDEALRLAQARQGELRAAVVDMMMPGMDGVQTIRALRQLVPNLPIVGCSGIDRYEAELAALGFARLKFLRKPFAVGDLLAALRDELRGAAPAGQPPAG
jgi:PAS domain S-box-containing protein